MFYSHEIIRILEKKNVNFVVNSYLGPIPFELDEMYPLAQSIFPDEIDQETREKVQQVTDRFLKNKTVIHLEDYTKIKKEKSQKKNTDLDIRRISAVSDMQFGRGASNALLNGAITIIKSKRTGKIRNIICDGDHVISMRANDGLFTLKLEGGRRLHKSLKYPLPAELSGGMKKRVGIARAIVLNPKYLFCDEPNSGLDPKTSLVTDKLIKEITTEFNMTTLVNTHDMNSVMEIGDYILFMHEGKKQWEGNSRESIFPKDEKLNQFIFASEFLQDAKEMRLLEQKNKMNKN